MVYVVTVATSVMYDVPVEAESFKQAAEKARELVNTEGIRDKIADAARDVVPEKILADSDTVVTAVHAFPETPAYA